MHISVVMAVYNARNSVERAVDSIRRQSYEDWDLVLVDDASDDGTRETLESILPQEPRISLMRNGVNRGLAASLNRGWRKARGELIARMDADDFSMPERLQRQADFMRSHPDIAVVGTAAKLIDRAGRFVGDSYRPAGHDLLVSKIYKENPFIHPSVMLRRNFLEALGGYDDALQRSQDYDLWLRGYRRFRYANLQEVLIRHTVRSCPSFKSVMYGIVVLGRAGHRDGRRLAASWYAFRYAMAAVLARLGVREGRLRTAAACPHVDGVAIRQTFNSNHDRHGSPGKNL